MSTVDFFFDLSCPYSFMVSTQINEICAKYNITSRWHPFLNSGQSTKPYTSAINKLKYNKKLLSFYAQRTIQNTKFYHKLHQTPQTLNAMVFATYICSQNQTHPTATTTIKQLFNSIWIQHSNITQSVVKFQQSSNYGIYHKILQQNTQKAAKQLNIFTVPSILINKTHLFVGLERLPNVDQMLNTTSIRPPISRIKYKNMNKGNKLQFYFDFSSPWAFLGYSRLYELFGFVDDIVFKPILLGALFRDIGTPNAPAFAMSKELREYGSLDMERWINVAQIKLKFTTHFPLRTVLPLRVFIINNKTIDCIYRGAWQWNVNIGDEKELCILLNEYGFDGDKLIIKAKSDKRVKNILRNNTQFAKKNGMFGVPSYVVNDDYDRFIWGQDKLDLVKDLCCGWKPILDVDSSAKL